MDNFAEAFAHFCHGMAVLFFLMRAVRLFPLRRRNGRFMVFFWTMACLAFIGLENIVYMAVTEWLSADMAYSGVLVDIFMVPVVALFFFETLLSAYLNGELNTTFYDYVNGYRVREACRLIDSGTRKTLAEISELSGFNSLSTFNRAFSRHAGMSPSEYMKSSASRSC